MEMSGGDDDRVITSSYYLSTPPDFDLARPITGNRTTGRTGVCAIFFHGVSAGLSFGGDGGDEPAEGTCGDALGAECVAALENRAWNFDLDSRASPQEQCDALRENLADNVDEACRDVSGDSWEGLRAFGKLHSPRLTSCAR